ncbi:MAG TPA: aminoglycoside phosphotransferase family protein [Mycobacteriales bacterium]|nr:aminoglycoside phosphotransferase family protein [Mycobacteriales bacterium]
MAELPDWFNAVEGPVTAALGGSVVGQALRSWGSSEVWRISSESGSVVVKRGRHGMMREARVYAELVAPLALLAPEILFLDRFPDCVVMVMRDVGVVTLEQNPSRAGYEQAARLLAAIHAVPVEGLSVPADLRRLPESFLDCLPVIEGGLRRWRPDLSRSLEAVGAALVGRLSGREHVVHGDVEAKNFVLGAGGLTLIDWPTASVSGHLGDVYTLARAAASVGIDRADVLRWYSGGAVSPALAGRVDVGGLCWTVEAVEWIVREGAVTVPDSIGWLDGLMDDLETLRVAVESR